MKRIFLLTSFLVLFIFSANVFPTVALPQNVQLATDEITELKKSNTLLKSQVNQLIKQRTVMQKQLQQDESNIASLINRSSKQEGMLAELNKTIIAQQAALDKVPEAIA